MPTFTMICKELPAKARNDAVRANAFTDGRKASGKSKTFAPNAPPVYALSKSEMKHCYNLIFDANGGCDAPKISCCTVPAEGCLHTFEISKSIPYRKGYNFKGWALSPDSRRAQYQPEGLVDVNSSTVLYAVWEKTNGKISAEITIKLIINGIKLSEIPEGLFLNATATDSRTGNTVWHGILAKEAANYNKYDNSLSWVIHAELTEGHAHIWSFAQSCSSIEGYNLSVASGPIYTGENLVSGIRCITNTYIKIDEHSIPYTYDTETQDDFLKEDGCTCKRFYLGTPLRKTS